ncbi:MAG TPA: acetyltransferase [Castellaniella sp.]|uniref:acetyltransferase n=1 Tax=Castellaniella sp. TaxID=1955812 RepID=UPI002EE922D6
MTVSKRTLGILGASGHGKVVAEVALAAGWEQVLFFDDAPDKTKIARWPVRGNQDVLIGLVQELGGVVVAIGNNSVRSRKLRQLQALGVPVVSLVHPAAVVSPSASLGSGTVVMAGVVVNADAKVGQGSILNTACTVDHDCVLGDAVHVSPGAHLAGGVHVGDSSWVGIGAVVRQGVNIGPRVVVGAGAAVVSDVTDGLTVVGVPAKPIRTTP